MNHYDGVPEWWPMNIAMYSTGSTTLMEYSSSNLVSRLSTRQPTECSSRRRWSTVVSPLLYSSCCSSPAAFAVFVLVVWAVVLTANSFLLFVRRQLLCAVHRQDVPRVPAADGGSIPLLWLVVCCCR
ncbi:hypothetical protein BRADI_2g13193v3 [Brachypodium distachyon]|uniref:Uncharacterized protein n=1 Tax=Brachypodium distachyon TaxID=15368 RepID=A0A0Q3QSA7_BRADI|nr:hypothetical protein BRADI_2g13193v3 [Brachypodium distachyon]